MQNLLGGQNGSASTGSDVALAGGEVGMSMRESRSTPALRIQNLKTSEERNTLEESFKDDFRTACERRVAGFPRYTVTRTPVGVLYCSATTYRMIPVEEDIFSSISGAEKTEVVTMLRRVAGFPRYTVTRTPVGVLYCSATTYRMIPVEEDIFSSISGAEKTEVVTMFKFAPSWWFTKIGMSRVIELVTTESSTRGWQYQLRTFNVSAWATRNCCRDVRKP